MIELDNVSFLYDDIPALSHVSFAVKEGEMLAVVGHNGSGKSTLAKLLNGLLLPSEGKVLVYSMDTAESEKLLSIRQHVGMVFQNPDNQLVTTIVEEDVAFGPESLGVPSEEIRKRVDESLKAVHMEKYAMSAPHMLSGGQKQRVAIAGMLAMRPKVIVLDEATSMLDPEGRADVWNVIRDLNRDLNMTVIIITQLMEEAVICDRVAVLCKGELKLLDTPKAVFRDAALIRSYGLDVPAMARMRNELINEGVRILNEPLTLEELADEIMKAASAQL